MGSIVINSTFHKGDQNRYNYLSKNKYVEPPLLPNKIHKIEYRIDMILYNVIIQTNNKFKSQFKPFLSIYWRKCLKSLQIISIFHFILMTNVTL